MSTKYVYFFGDGKADGKAEMKNLLGGKGANLAEMSNLGVPVPPGFTITTDVCTYYYDNGKKYPNGLDAEVKESLKKVEEVMGTKFGDPSNPLLVSIRSGARQSMPGMMETVLNVGLTSNTIKGLIEKTNNERFAYDAYRRLITMYSDVVMEKSAGIEPAEGMAIREQLEHELEKMAGVDVGDIMTSEPETVAPESSLEETATIMSEKGVHTIPVLDGDRLVGVVGKLDIVRSLLG